MGFISEKINDFNLQNIEPSSEEDSSHFDFASFFEDPEIKKAFMKLIVFMVEGSRLDIMDLRMQCSNIIINDFFPELSAHMNEYHIEQLLTNFALRISYGTKIKEVKIYYDNNEKALWCWEIQDH